nr:hypothetical protein [Heyndrickxia oleronia]
MVIRFTDAVNLPEEYTLGSTPANPTSFLASLNRTITPISEIIVAAIPPSRFQGLTGVYGILQFL